MSMLDILSPGTYVRHPEKPEWGLGQVQSVIGTRITVNFEHAGKRSINADVIDLELSKPGGGDKT